MNLSSFAFIVTGDCNLSCPYCYQKRHKTGLESAASRKALEYFFPHFTADFHIHFFGGEPLLAFERIKEIVVGLRLKNRDRKKAVHFTLSTNGSLVNDEVLEFLAENQFTVLLSFIGAARDIAPEGPRLPSEVAALKELLTTPGIGLITNSVFEPESVRCLADSVMATIELGVPSVNLSFSFLKPWDTSALQRLEKELSVLRDFSLSLFRTTRVVPVANFRGRPRTSLFGCTAGKDRLALSPEGDLWGCFQFYDFYMVRENPRIKEDYCFGSLDSFIGNQPEIYPKILQSYSDFEMANYYTSERACLCCPDFQGCAICPVDTAVGEAIIGHVPPWVCRIGRIVREQKRSFLRDTAGLV
jgi:MoaA/NifB/PqqE/SkfB family radical SAM enzyme